jgi:hypothetical protein
MTVPLPSSKPGSVYLFTAFTKYRPRVVNPGLLEYLINLTKVQFYRSFRIGSLYSVTEEAQFQVKKDLIRKRLLKYTRKAFRVILIDWSNGVYYGNRNR